MIHLTGNLCSVWTLAKYLANAKTVENPYLNQDDGQSLMQWHNARTKRSHEIMIAQTSKRFLVQMENLKNDVQDSTHEAFSYWKKVTESPFYFLRLFPEKKRMSLMKNIDISSFDGTLLRQVVDQRLKNLHRIIISFGGDTKISISFRKWKAYTDYIYSTLSPKNPNNIRTTYELYRSKRSSSILQTADTITRTLETGRY